LEKHRERRKIERWSALSAGLENFFFILPPEGKESKAVFQIQISVCEKKLLNLTKTIDEPRNKM
jgi:hypothetical protein